MVRQQFRLGPDDLGKLHLHHLGNPLVTVIADTQYMAIPTGLQYFPAGMIVQDASTGDMSIIQGAIKRALSTSVYQYLGNPPVTVIAFVVGPMEPATKRGRPGRAYSSAA